MLRVELLIPTLVRSGAEKQLTLLACGLPKDQFDVRVTCLTSGGPYVESLRKAEIPVTILNKRFQFDPLAWWRLRRHLKAATPDILHTWLFAANSYGRMALPRSSHTKTIVSERCVDSWKTWQLWVDRKLVSRTDCLVGNSQAVVDFYRPLGYRDDQLCVIPNGVEVPPQPSQSRNEFLAETRSAVRRQARVFCRPAGAAETSARSDLGHATLAASGSSVLPDTRWRWPSAKLVGATRPRLGG